jgi:cell wall-associated NlpC family hydrolase
LKASTPSFPETAPARPPASGCAPDRFILSGRSVALDRRVNAVRGDIADIALAGILFAPHYAAPMMRRCSVDHAVIRDSADESAAAISELLHGEDFAVIDISGGWAWGYCVHDHYVGYLPLDALSPPGTGPTHIVRSAQAALFAAPDAVGEPVGRWSMGSRFAASATDGAFLKTEAGYIRTADTRALGDHDADPVALAALRIGEPYFWGGRGHVGIDCSGLVQVVLGLCGIAAPRDSDQQQAALGEPIGEDAALQRGDLVFFDKHVGIMVDADRMIHANGQAQAVSVDALADVAARQPILARKRIAA